MYLIISVIQEFARYRVYNPFCSYLVDNSEPPLSVPCGTFLRVSCSNWALLGENLFNLTNGKVANGKGKGKVAMKQRGEGKAGLPVSGNTHPEVSP
jgi:hypothetical protein